MNFKMTFHTHWRVVWFFFEMRIYLIYLLNHIWKFQLIKIWLRLQYVRVWIFIQKFFRNFRLLTSFQDICLPTLFAELSAILLKNMRKNICTLVYHFLSSFSNNFQKCGNIWSIFWILKWIFIPIGVLFEFFSKC